MTIKALSIRWGIFLILSLVLNYILYKNKFRTRWDYYPPISRATYGIIMAGTSDKFSGYNCIENLVSPCIAKIYAERHKYAFKLVRNLEHIDSRKYGPCKPFPQWNKIKLLTKYIDDVDILLWIDLDAVITRLDTPLDAIIPDSFAHSACLTHANATILGSTVASNSKADSPGAVPAPFFWTTIDVNPLYSVNINTGVMALRSGDLAHVFLERVWSVGDNPYSFEKHDVEYLSKAPCSAYYGWPWEQGGVWDVLGNRSDRRFLRGTCVLPSDGPRSLNSVEDRYFDGEVNAERPFILHKPKVYLPALFQSILHAATVPQDVVGDTCRQWGVDTYLSQHRGL